MSVRLGNSVSGDEIKLSIVVPAFNEVGNIDEFVSRVSPILETVTNGHYEIIFSVDPCTDGTIEKINDLASVERRIKLLVFSRRVGQPIATLAALDHCRGNAAIVMDVDLQDPPELIPEMYAKWLDGYEVVYARRLKRDGETIIKKVVAKVGYGIIDRFGDVKIPRDTGDFRLLDRRVINELRNFPESHGFLRGLVALIGFRQAEVTFDRPARHSGFGNYNRFVGSLRIGFNGIIAFSSALLNLSTIIGTVAALSAFTLGIAYLSLKILGADFPIGNPTIVSLILFIGGMQLICLGIMGQYVARIYDEVKRRPKYIVDYALGIDLT